MKAKLLKLFTLMLCVSLALFIASCGGSSGSQSVEESGEISSLDSSIGSNGQSDLDSGEESELESKTESEPESEIESDESALDPDHEHSREFLRYNGTHHWYECVCGAKDGLEEHSFKDEICEICGGVKFSEGLEYELNSDGKSYSVVGIGSCTDTDIVIPSTYNDLPVMSIGEGAFYNCSSLISVEIPDSVTSIGGSAFRCSSLTSIEVSEENEAYKSIDGNLYTKDGKTLIQYAIGKTDKEFVIPDSVEYIGNAAFYSCSSLTSVEIPDSVTNIYNFAFCECSSITSVEIPGSVTKIWDNAFSRCSSLISIEVSEENEVYKSIDGNLYTKDGKTLIKYAIGKTDTEFVIPYSVTSIGSSAFEGCSSITSVEIPNSVKSIGYGAFYCCESLTSVVIPDSVTSIDMQAFYYCTSLTSVIIGDSVTSISHWAFSDCASLTSVVIGDSVTSIGGSAFSSCSSLTSVYYKGTASDWASISIGGSNSNLTNAVRYYYVENASDVPSGSGNYWHYDQNGNPIAW